jgi:hypothetical protein
MKRMIYITVAVAIMLISAARPAQAASMTVSGEVTDVYTYYDTVEISAYYPGEDGYHTNHRGAALSGLVDGIVATQTRGGHADLLGKTIMLVTPAGEQLIRKVDDRGCYRGRLDLLVADWAAMSAWGLAKCEVWAMEEG